MQPGQDTPDITPQRPAPTRSPAPERAHDPYIPRTVWQTPHGLAPTLTRQRAPRSTDIAKIMRRSLRLVYRLRRVSEGSDGARSLPGSGFALLTEAS